MNRPRTLASAAALLLALSTPGPAAAQRWAANPTAIAVRDATFEQTRAATHLFRSLDGSRSLLLLKRISVEDALDIAVDRGVKDLGTSSVPPASLDATRAALARHFAEQFRSENTAAYWYVYGTGATFAEALSAVFPDGASSGPDKGHVIRATADEERILFGATALRWSGHPLRVLAERTRADLVIVDDPTGLARHLSRIGRPSVKAILHVDVAGRDLLAVREQCRALLALRGLGLADVSVVDLLPSSTEDAKPWAYGTEVAAGHAQRAKRLESLLERVGLKANVTRPRTADAVVEAVNAAAAARRRVLLVAVAADGGATLRIPAQATGLTEKDVRRMAPSVSFVSVLLDAGEPLHHLDSLAFLGAVRADEPSSSPLLRTSLDRNPSARPGRLAETDVTNPSSVLLAIREATSSVAPRGTARPGPRTVARIYEFDAGALADAMHPRAPPANPEPSAGAGRSGS